MSKAISLKDLNAEQISALKKQVKEEEKNRETEVQQQRKSYKDKVNSILPALFGELTKCSATLALAKERVYNEVQSLVQMKSEVYDREQDQGSHSFTTDDGISITIGYRQLDGWDDTVEVGIQKVNDYVQSLGKDANSKNLVKVILQLLAKDKTGSLKASRVLQLKKMADEIGDAKLKDSLQIIQDAYRPSRTKQFISCRYKDAQGAIHELPLSITDVDIPNTPVKNGERVKQPKASAKRI